MAIRISIGYLLSARCDGRNRLAGVELVFQRDDFGSDVTTGGRGLLESAIGGESGHHVRMSGHEDPQADPGTSDRVSMRRSFSFGWQFSQLFE